MVNVFKLQDMSARRDLFKFLRGVMYIGAMYSPNLEQHLPDKLKKLGSLLELMIEIFLYWVTIHIAFLYTFTIYINFRNGDLEFLVNCFLQLIIYLWAIFMKLHFRRLQNDKLTDLIDFINLNYKTRSALGFTYVTMDDCWAMSNKWSKFFIYCCFIGTLFWVIQPIAHGDRSLPLEFWYPFDYKQPFVYEAMYFLQFVGQMQVSAAFATSSAFYMILAILISGQYDILNCSLKNFLATVALNSNTTNTELVKLQKLHEIGAREINEFYCSGEISCEIAALLRRKRNCRNLCFRIHFRNAIKECVDHHRYILKCLNKVEDFYNTIWFFKMGQVILLTCLVAFVSVKTTAAHSTFMKILSLGQYMLLIIWELLIICYSAETLHFNSQRCGEAILRSPWYLHLRDMKFDLLLFMLNSKRPFRLTAGRILSLNTELFKQTITTAFSFLTLLQKMDDSNE